MAEALGGLDAATRGRRSEEIAFVANALVVADQARPADAAAQVLDVVQEAVVAGVDLGVVDVVTIFVGRPAA